MKNKNNGWCDHCGQAIPTGDVCVIPKLPVDIPSAKAGESVTVCADCYIIILLSEENIV